MLAINVSYNVLNTLSNVIAGYGIISPLRIQDSNHAYSGLWLFYKKFNNLNSLSLFYFISWITNTSEWVWSLTIHLILW